MLKEDDDVENVLSPGVKLIQNFVTRVEERLKENFRKLRFDAHFPVNTAKGFLCDPTYIRGCQKYSFSNTSGHTEHLDWKSCENERDGEPATKHDEDQFSDKGLRDDALNSHILPRASNGARQTFKKTRS